MSSPASRVRAPDALDEGVVGGPPHRLVEVLDDGHLDAALGQPRQALPGVEQERRRRPGQDLVGMVVEGDDRRPGVAALRPRDPRCSSR